MKKLSNRVLRSSLVVAVLFAMISCQPASQSSPSASKSDGAISDLNAGKSISPVGPGEKVPDFKVLSFEGKEVRLSSFKGHPVMIDYWATWCPPCLEGLPHTESIFKLGANQGLKVMAICHEDIGPVLKLFESKKYTFPAYMDGESDFQRQYQIDEIPVVVVIDKEGKLVDYIVGGRQDERIKHALAQVGIKIDSIL